MVIAGTNRPSRTVDVVVGIACTVFSLAVLAILPVLTALDPSAALVLSPTWSVPWWLTVVCLVGQGIVLTRMRLAPRVSVLLVASLGFALSWVAPGSEYGVSNAAVTVVIFLAVMRVPLPRLRTTLVAAGLLVAAGGTANGILAESLLPGEAVIVALTQSVAVIGLPLLIGVFVRGRRDVREARLDEQKARTGERNAQVQAAVARERTAMARELHDIAAHHLSGIALMAAAIDRQIDTAPEQAHLGVQQLRTQSTMVLDDLRRLVGLLRDNAGGERSVETFETIPELITRAEAQGAVELRILSEDNRPLGDGVGPLAQLAAYRTIQEALTNAATHAPGARRVVEIDDRDETRAVITVTNTAPAGDGSPSSAGGFGLVGMRERAELVGADLRYGPTPDGGWQVRAAFQREAATPPPYIANSIAEGNG